MSSVQSGTIQILFRALAIFDQLTLEGKALTGNDELKDQKVLLEFRYVLDTNGQVEKKINVVAINRDFQEIMNVTVRFGDPTSKIKYQYSEVRRSDPVRCFYISEKLVRDATGPASNDYRLQFFTKVDTETVLAKANEWWRNQFMDEIKKLYFKSAGVSIPAPANE